MQHLNIEIKAKCEDPDYVRKMLEDQQASFIGLDHQVDTYFKVKRGRLKLREGNIEKALIHYDRPNQAGPKRSFVRLYEISSGSDLKDILSVANDILVVVDKQREIYFIDNVKFHIDQVEGLGTFVEIEAIDEDGNIGEEKLQQQCQSFMQLLKIDNADLVDLSYSDLLLQQKNA